ncbi:MAG: lipid hydroperoxide peroxidase [Flavobacteriales bacterium]|nr:MAG: lipid hydroperoxide peroxidase [Flavobacteriales bacterium]
MTTIFLKGNPVKTSGHLPKTGSKAPDFELVKTDLSKAKLSDYKGFKLILNIFPSIDTGTCAASVRAFNEKAAGMDNTKVLCISRDLPFAHARFCGAEGLANVESLSDFATGMFGKDYGLQIIDGPLAHLNSRVVMVLDEDGKIVYSEQVSEIVDEPNYEAALAAVSEI